MLNISVCRFAGPLPNEIGNFCELVINDELTIYDLSGNNKTYSIYDIYETEPDNISCLFQNTNGLRIVTLITCNNVNGKRLVIHAKEIP